MTAAKSKDLKKGARVYWRGDADDGGIVTHRSWDAVTIAGITVMWLLFITATCVKSCRRKHRDKRAIKG